MMPAMEAMDEHVTLRLVAEDDLPILDQLTQDPDAAGEFAWFGWNRLTRFRQWWADNRLMSDDIGVLMVVRGGTRLGTLCQVTKPSLSSPRTTMRMPVSSLISLLSAHH